MKRLCRSLLLPALFALSLSPPLPAQTLSTSREINFYRDIPSRNLKGLATRSDGVLLSGPHISPLLAPDGQPLAPEADLLWSATLISDTLHVGTGPEGKILRYRLVENRTTLSPLEPISLSHDSHLLALAALPDGGLLAGSSPEGALVLIGPQGEAIARAVLPVGSILAIEINTKYQGNEYALVATGSPARVYRVNLTRFRESEPVEAADAKAALGARGIELWGSVRDEAIRALLSLPDGRVIAGSAPKGNVYEFAEQGGEPRVLSENSNAEVTSLLAWEGGFFAALTSGDTGRRAAQVSRGNSADNVRPAPARDSSSPSGGGNGDGSGGSNESGDGEARGESEQGSNRERAASPLPAPAAAKPKFSGSSRLLWFPDGGFPETAAARQGVGFYQLARHGDLVIITAGDEGELLGYDPKSRLGMVFAGATAAQVNGILPLAAGAATSAAAGTSRAPSHAQAGFLLVGNNPASLELMDFGSAEPRTAITRRIDLGSPAELGALRFAHLAETRSPSLRVELRTSESSDPLEGWGRWEHTTNSPHDMLGYRVERPPLRGRYVQFRLTALSPSDAPPGFEAESPRLYLLPQNQRPQLANFVVLPPSNARSGTDTLRKLVESTRSIAYREDLAAANDTPLHRTTRVIVWELSDPNDDALRSTLSVLGPEQSEWLPILIDSPARYAIFDTAGLTEGRYRTQLEVRETAPRPAAQRLSVNFEGEAFFIDHTAPEILNHEVLRRPDGGLTITLLAQDLDSLLLGAEVRLNNGNRYEFSQTLDGILDSKRETFVLELDADQVGPSTHLDATVIDSHYNTASQRLPIPPKN